MEYVDGETLSDRLAEAECPSRSSSNSDDSWLRHWPQRTLRESFIVI
jgi:hypothetical protein